MSKFREHLSLTLPPGHLDLPVEQSKFSPASTIDPSPRYSESMRNPFHPLSPKDVEAGTPHLSLASSLSPNPTTQVLSADALQCISQYTLNAPSSPSSYPCSSCLPALQGVPSSFMSNSANAQDAQTINNAVQFCSLRAVYETANAQGQTTLGNGSWSQNLNFCTWTGVTCDTSGRVSSLALTYPGVPATLPNEIGALSDLQVLTVVGGNTIPAGSLPESFVNLTAMTTLHLESTAITALPDTLFSSPGLTNISTLALLRNSDMGTSLPTSITELTGLHSLLVNSQVLSPSPLSTIVNSSTLAASLQTLDLTSTSLTGTIPTSISSFKNLTQLLLSSNNLTGTVPAMPSTLKVLQLGENSALTGTFACSVNTLQTCSVAGTNVSVAGCGVCQNATTSS
ncbi:hypothetical protein M404DRAFT_446365 [Pisolithus tinctorius Marx 270]|uniref:Leucine-rich repeat-containing N-terminal plant-type domain-containing protein n=1 Tax=Pisolithus tinctorius Marx 270 TaxID=870435 RepID=A0A0C3PIC9_PISTI|nr:hypothetical protein M404DRAFT_446365 [Pisolithus tinctorius Marx 270]